MHKITKDDLKYAEGIAFNTCPIKDFDHPLFKECLSAARYGLADAARKYRKKHPKSNWLAFRALRIWGEVMEVVRRENIQGNIGLSHRGRDNKDVIELQEFDTLEDTTLDPRDENPEQLLLREECGVLLHELLDNWLPATEAGLLELHYLEGMTLQEVSKYSHLPEEEIKVKIKKGLEDARKVLEKMGYGK